ncbi:MAG: dihydrofolate reductase [Bdellovibrio sp.]
MIISLIAAVGKNRQLGGDNKMLWHIPEDFKQFKRRTMNHHMIMGRKTFESIGRPLPGRISIVLSRDKKFKALGVFIFDDLNTAIEYAREQGETELFIIGGAQIYQQALPLADKIYLSEVDYDDEADAFFPEFNKEDWKELSRTSFPRTEKSPSWNLVELSRNRRH